MSQLTNCRSVLTRVGTCAITLAIVAVGLAGGAPGAAMAAPETEGSGAGETLPVGAPLPSPEYCSTRADAVGSGRESVPENSTANHSMPEALELPPWPDYWDPSVNRRIVTRIDGRYTGTTDQILVWGACKWGIDADVVRAMAMAESSWRQSKVGDFVSDPGLCVGEDTTPCPTSFGILQVKHVFRPGSWPYSQRDTAFNVDYALGVLRGCFEGLVTYLDHANPAGDLWGCVGWYFSGNWKDDMGLAYAQRVQDQLNARYWTRW